MNALVSQAVDALSRDLNVVDRSEAVLLYGSAMDNKSFRDIDLLLVSSNVDRVLVRRSVVAGIPVNAYVVNRIVLQRDIQNLERGQFYSYKLAFGVELVRGSPRIMSELFREFVEHTLGLADEALAERRIVHGPAISVGQVVARILLYRLCFDASFFVSAERLAGSEGSFARCVGRYIRVLGQMERLGLYEMGSGYGTGRISAWRILIRYWLEYSRKYPELSLAARLSKTIEKVRVGRAQSRREFRRLFQFLATEANADVAERVEAAERKWA